MASTSEIKKILLDLKYSESVIIQNWDHFQNNKEINKEYCDAFLKRMDGLLMHYTNAVEKINVQSKKLVEKNTPKVESTEN